MMTDPDNVDEATANSSWLFTVKIFVPNLIPHDDPTADPDPPTVAMELISEENGFGGFCDFPEHYQIQNLVPYSKAAWQDTIQTRKRREQLVVRAFLDRVRSQINPKCPEDILLIIENEYAKMTSTT